MNPIIGTTRFGWSYNAASQAEVLSLRIGKIHKIRFPDIVSSQGIGKVKNVDTISNNSARQIADYARFSNSAQMGSIQLWTRPGTNVSAVQGLIDSGLVQQRLIPGVNNLGVYSLSGWQALGIGASLGSVGSIGTMGK